MPAHDMTIETLHQLGAHEGEAFDPMNCADCRADGEHELGRLRVWGRPVATVSPPRVIVVSEPPPLEDIRFIREPVMQAHQPDWVERHRALVRTVDRVFTALGIAVVAFTILYFAAHLVVAFIGGIS